MEIQRDWWENRIRKYREIGEKTEFGNIERLVSKQNLEIQRDWWVNRILKYIMRDLWIKTEFGNTKRLVSKKPIGEVYYN